MKSVKEINVEIEQLQTELIEAKKAESKDALAEVKRPIQRVWFYFWYDEGCIC